MRWSLEHGGVERGQGHYPAMVVLHTGLLVGCLAEVWLADRPFDPALGWTMLVVVVAAQALRWWCIRTLGPRWNTQVVVVPGLPLVTGGPYRILRHPNYVAVVAEGVALPLVHSAWLTALVFTVLNAWLLTVRITTARTGRWTRPAGDACGRGGRPAVIDLLVVGGGPAGLATAVHAALAGMEAVVVEPRSDARRQGLRRGRDARRGTRPARAGRRRFPAATRCAASATYDGTAPGRGALRRGTGPRSPAYRAARGAGPAGRGDRRQRSSPDGSAR